MRYFFIRRHRVTRLIPRSCAMAAILPFRALMRRHDIIVMLGHARLTAFDATRPVSFSQPVVHGLLRTDWGYDGLLMTDDFSMGAVTYSAEGIGGGDARRHAGQSRVDRRLERAVDEGALGEQEAPGRQDSGVCCGTDRGPEIVLAFRVGIHGHGLKVGLRVPEVLPGPARWPSIDGC